MAYKHLSEDERYQIYEWNIQGLSRSEMAHRLGRHPSSIGRELKRNRGERGYRAKQAHGFSQSRKSNNARKIKPEVWFFVEKYLRQEWSPENISLRFQLDHGIQISHERIYQYIYARKKEGDSSLGQHLRCQRRRRRRYGAKYKKRGQILDRVGIERRPQSVLEKKIIGHWEGDTIHGLGGKSPIITLVERKSQYLVLAQSPSKRAEQVAHTITQNLKLHEKKVKTITFDNGLEFARHKEINKKLESKSYFADPYYSWQRGLNEQVNGLLRQYFPKKMDFTQITPYELKKVQDKLNNRPRKTLGAKTPYEVFYKLRKPIKIALRT